MNILQYTSEILFCLCTQKCARISMGASGGVKVGQNKYAETYN